MIRRISTKLILAVLTAVVLPFAVFAYYMNEQMAERLTRHVVRQALLGLVKDMAGQVDYFLVDRHKDVEQWADMPQSSYAIENYVVERRLVDSPLESSESRDDLPVWDAQTLSAWARGEATVDAFAEFLNRSLVTREFDRYIHLKGVYDLILLVSADGRLVTSSSRHPDEEDQRLPDDFLAFLFSRSYEEEEWFQAAKRGLIYSQDHHVSPYRVPGVGQPNEADWGYHLGFAAPVHHRGDADQVVGVLYALVNWHFVQEIVGNEVVKDAFRGFVEEEPSPYAWIWARDADTILAHIDTDLYYQSVSNDVGLPELTRAVLENEEGFGLFPEYLFRDKEKNAAFQRSSAEGGFQWVVGVGIDNDDIYQTAGELRTMLLGGTSLVVVMAVLWTLLIARKTTGPIRELQGYTRRVAEGDLDARVHIRSRDELGALATDFNQMTRDLKEQRERIVKAEKDAAWREMARQIAHDIKNPLTPISLSLDLLERARRERAEGSEEILERTMGLIRRQVQNLQQIAGDFYEFTGGQKPNPVPVDVVPLLEEVLHLHDAWAVELGVEIRLDGPDARVMADTGKLRRVFVNLVSNALQAMTDGGTLFVETAIASGRVRIIFRDTGVGIPEEASQHLFEPYFTTKSEGTGLGLAISKQVIEQMGGAIELWPVDDENGTGTVATIHLPLSDRREDART